VHPELEQLLILQDRQQKIRHIQAEIKTLPSERAHLESQLAATAAGVESLKQKGRQVEVERKRLELDVGTRNESIVRLRPLATKLSGTEMKSANSKIRNSN
jgi:uncharacterized protein